MFDSAINFCERLVTEFTWRRLVFVLTVLSALAASVIAYESYTGHFRLGRLERSVKLLDDLATIQPQISKTDDKGLVNAYEAIRSELEEYSNHKLSPLNIPRWAAKSLAALAPWILFLFIIYLAGTTGMGAASAGALVCAAPFVAIAALLPDYEPPWLNYVAYPIASCVLPVLLVVAWARWHKKG